MSRAVFWKTWRDYLLLTMVLSVSIVLFEIGVVRMMMEAAKDLELLRNWLERPFIKTMIQIALGADPVGDLTPTTLATMGLAHPLLYAFAWTLLLTIGTGVVAGEISRGTADLLLTLPVSRAAVYTSTTLVWLMAAFQVSLAPLVGLWIGERVFPLAEPLDFMRLWPVAVNFFALNVCVTGVTMMVSSMSSRRGTAVGIVMTTLLASDLVNLLAQFWDAIRSISFLGFLHYFRPLPVVRSGSLPWGDIGILMAVAVVMWAVGLRHFCRRDVPAA